MERDERVFRRMLVSSTLGPDSAFKSGTQMEALPNNLLPTTPDGGWRALGNVIGQQGKNDEAFAGREKSGNWIPRAKAITRKKETPDGHFLSWRCHKPGSVRSVHGRAAPACIAD